MQSATWALLYIQYQLNQGPALHVAPFLHVPCSVHWWAQAFPLCNIHEEKAQVLISIIYFAEIKLNGRKCPALCRLYWFKHGTARWKLSFLISHLIKLTAAISSFSSVFMEFCGGFLLFFHIVKLLEAELYFHLVGNPEKALISAKICYLGAFPQTWSLC